MTRTPLIDRRTFLKAAGVGFLASLPSGRALALERTDAVFAAAFRGPDGAYGLALVSERGEIVSPVTLPGRAHGLGHCQTTGRVVAFARRPGTFAAILEPVPRSGITVISAPEGRHFYGHGQFSPDGKLLYASENDFDNNRGMIGLYDATDGFARIGEFPAYGVGTHDMTVSDDGSLLIVANGGIETHPDFGRTKLNLDRMEPSLVLVDAKTGALIEKHGMPPALSQLSTRHVDVGADGRIWFACQYEGPRNDTPPLVGFFSKGEEPTLLSLPEDVTTGLGNYVGAIAVNRHEGLVGITSPKGLAVTIDARTSKVVASRILVDAAGIAAAPSGFAVSSYGGSLAQTRSGVAWDQHMVRLQTV